LLHFDFFHVFFVTPHVMHSATTASQVTDIQTTVLNKKSSQICLHIIESKGLEFQDVWLVDFFSSCDTRMLKDYRQLFRIKGSGDKARDADTSQMSLRPELEVDLKLLYTAITRCKARLVLVETGSGMGQDDGAGAGAGGLDGSVKENLGLAKTVTAAFFRWLKAHGLAKDGGHLKILAEDHYSGKITSDGNGGQVGFWSSDVNLTRGVQLVSQFFRTRAAHQQKVEEEAEEDGDDVDLGDIEGLGNGGMGEAANQIRLYTQGLELFERVKGEKGDAEAEALARRAQTTQEYWECRRDLSHMDKLMRHERKLTGGTADTTCILDMEGSTAGVGGGLGQLLPCANCWASEGSGLDPGSVSVSAVGGGGGITASGIAHLNTSRTGGISCGRCIGKACTGMGMGMGTADTATAGSVIKSASTTGKSGSKSGAETGDSEFQRLTVGGVVSMITKCLKAGLPEEAAVLCDKAAGVNKRGAGAGAGAEAEAGAEAGAGNGNGDGGGDVDGGGGDADKEEMRQLVRDLASEIRQLAELARSRRDL
jgi:hypothetical protein